MSLQEGLEGVRGRDRVQRLPYFKEVHGGKETFFSKFCKQDGKLDYSRYCQLPL